jgi:hypothetical protein
MMTGTYWECSDFEGYRFYLWLVDDETAFMHDSVRATHVSVPVSSLGTRWRQVKARTYTSGQLGVDA